MQAPLFLGHSKVQAVDRSKGLNDRVSVGEDCIIVRTPILPDDKGISEENYQLKLTDEGDGARR